MVQVVMEQIVVVVVVLVASGSGGQKDKRQVCVNSPKTTSSDRQRVNF